MVFYLFISFGLKITTVVVVCPVFKYSVLEF